MKEKVLLTDEEITIANQIPPEEYGAPPGWWHRVSKKVAQAQLDKAEPIICKDERERIRQMVMGKYNGAYPDAYKDAIIEIWQTLKE